MDIVFLMVLAGLVVTLLLLVEGFSGLEEKR